MYSQQDNSQGALYITNEYESINAFEVIPTEIIELIINQLNIHSLRAFSSVCRKFANLCKNESIWQKQVSTIWDLNKRPLNLLPLWKSWKFITFALYSSDFLRPAGTGSQYKNQVYEKDGLAIINYYDSRYYEGQVRQGIPFGMGRMVSPLFTYEGQFEDGYRNGKGTLTLRTGITYEGEFKASKQHGYGIKIWANGNKYQGDFKNDKTNGKGIYTWKTGQRFEGDFVNDTVVGVGLITLEAGFICKYDCDKSLIMIPDGRIFQFAVSIRGVLKCTFPDLITSLHPVSESIMKTDVAPSPGRSSLDFDSNAKLLLARVQ